MNTPAQIAKNFRAVIFGGNWTWSNLKDQLADVTWQQATTQVNSLNTIATLTFHCHYYVGAAVSVLQGQPLTASDKYAFTHPPIQSKEDWDNFTAKVWEESEAFAVMVEQFPEERLDEIFVDEKYGNFYRNFHGIIEHTHYHLGQIALIKKIILQADPKPADEQ